jgi:uncharacterized protein (TIGR02453 family)
MGFNGWPASAIEFYEGLEADNSKAYWNEHKPAYERDVKAPMLALLDELAGEFGESRLFRPNRDIRFSADKSPYKTSIAAMAGDCYIQLSTDGLMAGAGSYHMSAGQLERYRTAVDNDASGQELEAIAGDLRAAKINLYGSDALKTAPKGYPKDHPRIEFLRYRGLVAMKSWPPAPWMGTAAAKKRIVEVFRAARPLTEWLATCVGPEEAGEMHRR